MNSIIELTVNPGMGIVVLIALFVLSVVAAWVAIEFVISEPISLVIVVAIAVFYPAVGAGAFFYSAPTEYNNPVAYQQDLKTGSTSHAWWQRPSISSYDAVEALVKETSGYDAVAIANYVSLNDIWTDGNLIEISVRQGSTIREGTLHFTPDSFILSFPVIDSANYDTTEYSL